MRDHATYPSTFFDISVVRSTQARRTAKKRPRLTALAAADPTQTETLLSLAAADDVWISIEGADFTHYGNWPVLYDRVGIQLCRNCIYDHKSIIMDRRLVIICDNFR